MAFALISGSLTKNPEQKSSKSGNPYVVATIRTKDGQESQFWRIMAFSESVREELTRLRDGDALAVQGVMRAEVWTPEGGEPRINLSVIADAVLVARQPKKASAERPETISASKEPILDRARGNGVDVFGDDVGF